MCYLSERGRSALTDLGIGESRKLGWATPRVFNAPADCVSLGVGYNGAWAQETRMMRLPARERSLTISLAA